MEQISEITTHSKNNNLDYRINSTFRSINRLFVLSFKNGNNNPTKNFFDKCYLPLVEIKDFNALFDNKPYFDQPAAAYEKLIEMPRNNDDTTGNLLDYWSVCYNCVTYELQRESTLYSLQAPYLNFK